MTDGDPSRTARRDRDLAPPVWAGVDVGGRRKGFHVALIACSVFLAAAALIAAKTGRGAVGEHRDRDTVELPGGTSRQVQA